MTSMVVSSFASRLRDALSARNMTQAELAQKSGISKSSISRYLSGAWKGKQDSVYALAKALDVSESWLMGYDVPMDRVDLSVVSNSITPIPPGFEPPPKMRKVPLIGEIACGEPILAEQNIEDYLDVPEEVHCDFLLRCKGDSMIDAGIQSGDVVFVRLQETVENGEIAAVRIGDEATLKRVYWDGDTLMLMPANNAYAPKSFRGEEINDVHIEGKAIGFMHMF